MADPVDLDGQVHLQTTTEEESDLSDDDSTLGTDNSSVTESLSSSIMAYEYENGRRYHAYAAGRYVLPNDEREAERLDIQHHMWFLALEGKLYLAPIPEDITSALDIGTGTGIWAIEFADDHPHCNITGTDLSPIQQTWVPPNCSFLIDDADSDKEWIFEPVDFIHSRLLTVAIRDWPRYFRKCYDALKPGGYIEVQECLPQFGSNDDSNVEDDPCNQWASLMREGSAKVGLNTEAMWQFEKQLKDAGFVDIVKKDDTIPMGGWEIDPRRKEMGELMRINGIEGLNSSVALLTRVLGWSKEEADILNAKCRTSLKDNTKRRFVPMTVHYARKPFQPAAFGSVEQEATH